MKKIILSLLCAGLLLSGIACTSDEKANDTEEEVTTEAPIETSADTEETFDSKDFDYSKPFDENGYWADVKALDFVTLCDYKNIEIPSDDELSADGSDRYTYVGNYLIDNCKVESYPDSMYQYHRDLMCVDFANYAKSQNSTYSEKLAELGYPDTDSFVVSSKTDIENEIKKDLILQAIAEENSITVDEEFLAEYLKNDYQIDDFSKYEEFYGIGYLKYSTLGEVIIKSIEEGTLN